MPEIINCPKCGEQTYAEVANCPHCGENFHGGSQSATGEGDATIQGGTLRVGKCISSAFSILFKNIVPFLLLGMLVLGLMYIAIHLLQFSNPPTQGGWGPLWVLLAFLIYTVFYQVVTATIVYGTVQELRNRRAKFSDSIQRGLSVIFPAFVVGLLVALLTVLGFLAFIIPGIMVVVAFYVAIPAVVVERTGVFASLRRSRALTKGYRWPLFGLLLFVTVVNWVISFVLSIPLAMLIAYGISPIVAQWLTLPLEAFFAVFGAVITAVAYVKLRIIKENFNVEEVAAVFD